MFRSIAVAVVCLLAAAFSPAVAAARPAADADLDRVAADTAVLRDPTGRWTLDDVRKHSDRLQHRGFLTIDVRALEDAKRIAESARAAVHGAEIPHSSAESGVVTVRVVVA